MGSGGVCLSGVSAAADLPKEAAVSVQSSVESRSWGAHGGRQPFYQELLEVRSPNRLDSRSHGG